MHGREEARLALAVSLRGTVKQRSNAGDDIVGEGQGLGVRLLEEPRVLAQVTAEEAVMRAVETLRSEHAL